MPSLIFSILLLAASGAALDAQIVLPMELVEHAASIGCGPLQDYYSAPGRVHPPYVFGYRSASDERSAVYWCEPGAAGERSRLVIWHGAEQREPPACERLNWINPGRGLSLRREQQPMSAFSFVDAARIRVLRSGLEAGPAEPGPPGVTSGPIIVSEYDGVIEEFYCHMGRWLVRGFH